MTDERDFAEILAEFEKSQGGDGATPKKGPKVGDRVRGTVLSVGRETAFVDLVGKTEGTVAIQELIDDEGDLTHGVGEEIEGMVTGTDDSGCLILRVKAGRVQGGEAAQEEIAQAFRAGLPVEGQVEAVNKGGVEVVVAGLRAFCPISQLEMRFVEDATEYIGRTLSFRIVRFEEVRGRPNVVLSRRALLEEEAKAQAEATRAKLSVGAILEGTVTSLTSYGAFVDLGGLEGLLHVSQISHRRLEHPQEELSVGQRLEVEILKIEEGRDGKGERVSLSRRSLEDDPWDQAAKRFPPGAILSGRVLRIEQFGAFVEIAPGLTGLLHISELGRGRRLAHAREAVELGQDLSVRVLSVDEERRRISLTLDAAVDDGEAEGTATADSPAAGSPAAGSKIPPRVQSTGGLGSLGDILKASRSPDEGK
ncbi:MAG: S1 RNA-binding domain-containing protein [Acidobacteriota bacterium]